jgi:hypothetical protein
MESIKVQEWVKNQVFNEISSLEWVELKKVGLISNLFVLFKYLFLVYKLKT